LFAERLLALGVEVEIPDLECGDFRGLTVTKMLRIVEQKIADGPVVLMGSSLGGYVAALFAFLHPGQVQKLVLLAPAFGFADRWLAELGVEAAQGWRQTGALKLPHYGRGEEAEIGWGLIEDAMRYPANPPCEQPVLVFHGLNDEVVPVAAARLWCASREGARLVELASGHELTDVFEPMWAEARPFILDSPG